MQQQEDEESMQAREKIQSVRLAWVPACIRKVAAEKGQAERPLRQEEQEDEEDNNESDEEQETMDQVFALSQAFSDSEDELSNLEEEDSKSLNSESSSPRKMVAEEVAVEDGPLANNVGVNEYEANSRLHAHLDRLPVVDEVPMDSYELLSVFSSTRTPHPPSQESQQVQQQQEENPDLLNNKLDK